MPDSQSAEPSAVILFENVRIFDGKSDTLSGSMNVLVRGNTIDKISKDPIPTDRSANTKIIAGGGRTLMPGLIDMHVHLDSPADIGGYRGLEFTDSFWAMTAVGNARAMLDAGFTTVRNVGASNRNDVGLKQAIEAGVQRMADFIRKNTKKAA